jgi:hypothetical protein
VSEAPLPLVVAVNMGYGHMRPGTALADHLGTELLRADEPPLARADESRLWARIRRIYEATTRWSSFPFFGAPFRYVVSSATEIPHLHPYRDQSKPTWSVRQLRRAVDNGLGHGLVETMRETGRPLLTTYFAPAHAADAAGLDRIYCVVTDSDIHRIWAPLDPETSRIQYLVPSMRALRRLRAYGVRRDHIRTTGYPLPHELLGGEELTALKRNLAARLTRLDPKHAFHDAVPGELRHFLGTADDDESQANEPPLLTFAVGGAGAQTDIVRRFLPGLKDMLERGRLKLALVAGVRRDVADVLAESVERAGVADLVEIAYEPVLADYFHRFHALLARTDILWTKPSEMTFFGALGLALVLSPPVGVHEWYNRRWARESGAALKQRDPRHAYQWLREWLEDGLLAAAAWSGYTRLPKFGLYRILAAMRGERSDATTETRSRGTPPS